MIFIKKKIICLIGLRNLTTEVDRKERSTITTNTNEIKDMVGEIEENDKKIS